MNAFFLKKGREFFFVVVSTKFIDFGFFKERKNGSMNETIKNTSNGKDSSNDGTDLDEEMEK